MIIGLDFDGTCVAHEYPQVGKDIGAVPYLKRFLELGHKIVLNTMRSGKGLEEAVQWFKDNDIELYGINHNPDQDDWTTSPKVYANLYIDDAALGIPLKKEEGCRPYVNWFNVSLMMGIEI